MSRHHLSHLFGYVWRGDDSLPRLVRELVLRYALAAATAAAACGSRTCCQRASPPSAGASAQSTPVQCRHLRGDLAPRLLKRLCSSSKPTVPDIAAASRTLYILLNATPSNNSAAAWLCLRPGTRTSQNMLEHIGARKPGPRTCQSAGRHSSPPSQPLAGSRRAPCQSAAGLRRPRSCCSERCARCRWSSMPRRWPTAAPARALPEIRSLSQVPSAQRAVPPAGTSATPCDLRAPASGFNLPASHSRPSWNAMLLPQRSLLQPAAKQEQQRCTLNHTSARLPYSRLGPTKRCGRRHVKRHARQRRAGSCAAPKTLAFQRQCCTGLWCLSI